MGNCLSNSSSSDAPELHCPAWAQKLTGDATTTVHSVNIQNKKKLPSILKGAEAAAGHGWLEIAKRPVERGNDDAMNEYAQQLRDDDWKNYDRLMKEREKQLQCETAPKALFHDDGGVQLTHRARKFPFFYALYAAYMQHGELLLSPDDVWRAIQLSLSRYINENPSTAERLRCMRNQDFDNF